jgi:hypothetical protein
VLGGTEGELYLQGEAATGTFKLPEPFNGRAYHLYCSPNNAGAKEVAAELAQSDIIIKGELKFTDDSKKLEECDHMLVLLDERTWTSGATTDGLVDDIHVAMAKGVHILCVHEFPSVVGPARHECEFALMFNDDWTPPHMVSGPTNLYKEIALALKGAEWRKPGLVALAAKLSAGGSLHKPIKFNPPRKELRPPAVVPPTRRASKQLEMAADAKALEALSA